MSLENQIADLVSASRGLIATFEQKKAGIDAAVLAALQALPANTRTFYVSALTGNDAAAGTLQAPLKTLKQAIDRVPVGGFADIYLAEGEEHLIDSQITVANKVLILGKYGQGGRPVLKSMPYVEAGMNLCYGISPYGGTTITFTGLRVKTAVLADPAKPSGDYGFISRSDCTAATVFMNGTDIELNGQSFMSGSGAGSVMTLFLYNHQVTRTAAGSYIASIGSNNLRLAVAGVTLPAATQLADLLSGITRDANNVPRNLLCNIAI